MPTYTREFFELQWRFAIRVAVLAGRPIEDVLLSHTNFYARFGLGRGDDATDPTWRAYLDGVRHSAVPVDHTWDFYRTRLPDEGAPGVVARVGCFSYAPLTDGAVRLHFHDAEAGGLSPLADSRAATRRGELRALFEDLVRREGAALQVVGNSWLYHLPAYRRLFPAAYLATARPSLPRFNGMPLWGQFLARDGRLRQHAVDRLFERLDHLTDAKQLATCFPYGALTLRAQVACFA